MQSIEPLTLSKVAIFFFFIISNFHLDQIYFCTTWESQCFHSCHFTYLFCPSFLATMVWAHRSWLSAVSFLSRHYSFPQPGLDLSSLMPVQITLSCGRSQLLGQGLPWGKAGPWAGDIHGPHWVWSQQNWGRGRTWLPRFWESASTQRSHSWKQSVTITPSAPVSTAVDTPWGRRL